MRDQTLYELLQVSENADHSPFGVVGRHKLDQWGRDGPLLCFRRTCLDSRRGGIRGISVGVRFSASPDDTDHALGGTIPRYRWRNVRHKRPSRWRCGRLGWGAYAVTGRLSGGGIVVSSCDGTVRVRGRPLNAPIASVSAGRRGYLRTESKLLIENVVALGLRPHLATTVGFSTAHH